MKNLIIAALAALSVSGCFVSCGTTQKTESADSTMTQVKHLDWTRNAVIYEVNLRQYTPEGTFKAFQAHLPRLKELGVDILWFMPIHPISELNRKGELGSYYAVKDYKAVNPEYGTMEDFKSIVSEAHKMGMKIILDWVPNHSGCDHAWVTEHPEWYVRDSVGNMVGPYDWTDVYKFDYTNREMRSAMLDALKFWVRDIDIDGYRCDVAAEVPTDFWNDVRPALDSIKPVFMLAESDRPFLAEKAFDMVYNWPLMGLLNEVSHNAGSNAYNVAKEKALTVRNALSIDTLLAKQATEFPKDSYLMNMITNHDENSWNGTEFERMGDAMRTYVVLTYTLPGMPLIYTGQECGMNHPFEFFKKDKSPSWEKNDAFEFFKQLNMLKHETTALRAGIEGAPMVRYATGDDFAYVFSRSNDEDGVYVFLNFSGKDVALDYTGAAPSAEKATVNYFSGEEEEFPTMLKPWEYKVFVLK